MQTFGKAKGRFNESVSGIKLWNSTFKAIEGLFYVLLKCL